MLKLLLSVVAIIAFLCVSVVLYIFREQAIRVDFIPEQFNHCGKLTMAGDHEYDRLVEFLKRNKNGWVLSFASYVPSDVYKSPAFNVNILDNLIVVSYKTENGFPQFIKKIRFSEVDSCSQ